MTCYLIHFDTPYKHAQHYMGYTSRSARARFAEHLTGSDVALVRAARDAGITMRLARIWGKEGRAFESRHKYRAPGQHRHGTKRSLRPLCPICRKERTATP